MLITSIPYFAWFVIHHSIAAAIMLLVVEPSASVTFRPMRAEPGATPPTPAALTAPAAMLATWVP